MTLWVPSADVIGKVAGAITAFATMLKSLLEMILWRIAQRERARIPGQTSRTPGRRSPKNPRPRVPRPRKPRRPRAL